MNIILEFTISLCLFIYGLQLFSKGLENLFQKKIKTYLIKYTNRTSKGIILGTILTALIGSSSLTTILTISLVNKNIISFHNSLGIIMGANLGTCLTSFLTAFLSHDNSLFIFLNPNTYTPFIILIGLFYYFKNKQTKSNVFIGFSLFILGLKMLQNSLNPLQEYEWFKSLIKTLNNPFLALLSGFFITSLIQSSSATIAILQGLTKSGTITYLNSIPIIMGENIGTCLTSLIATFKTNKNAKKVALSNLFYNIIGTIFFMILFYFTYILKLNFLNQSVNSLKIAFIHTLFNFLSIIIFYPFLKIFEKLINKLFYN